MISDKPFRNLQMDLRNRLAGSSWDMVAVCQDIRAGVMREELRHPSDDSNSYTIRLVNLIDRQRPMTGFAMGSASKQSL